MGGTLSRASGEERARLGRQLTGQLRASAFDVSENERDLGILIVSRLIDDVEAVGAPEELRDLWRRQSLDQFLNHPALALPAAKLAFERGDYAAARGFFSAAGSRGRQSERDLVLAAYNLELLGRDARDLDALGEAEALWSELLADHADSELGPELLHGLGHTKIAQAVVAGRPDGDDAEAGERLLRQASDRDASYTSCYTSCFSELGEYFDSIITSLDVLRNFERVFSTLSMAAAETVHLEVLFYLGHALTCVGEYERGLLCFDGFAQRMEEREDVEGRDHARLFRIKTELKRRLISDLNDEVLDAYFRELRRLSFPSRSGQVVADEALRYEQVVQFLIAVSEGRGTWPYAEATSVAQSLLHARPQIASTPCATLVGPTEDWQGLIDAFGPAVAVHDLVPPLHDLAEVDVVASTTRLELAAPGPVGIEIAGERATGWHDQERILAVADAAALRQAVTVGVGMSLTKRFLLDDEYVFAIVPCADSPAMRHQRPDHDWDWLAGGSP
jgi:tetratricopeptide (TPR) repeat protein